MRCRVQISRQKKTFYRSRLSRPFILLGRNLTGLCRRMDTELYTYPPKKKKNMNKKNEKSLRKYPHSLNRLSSSYFEIRSFLTFEDSEVSWIPKSSELFLFIKWQNCRCSLILLASESYLPGFHPGLICARVDLLSYAASHKCNTLFINLSRPKEGLSEGLARCLIHFYSF